MCWSVAGWLMVNDVAVPKQGSVSGCIGVYYVQKLAKDVQNRELPVPNTAFKLALDELYKKHPLCTKMRLFKFHPSPHPTLFHQVTCFDPLELGTYGALSPPPPRFAKPHCLVPHFFF